MIYQNTLERAQSQKTKVKAFLRKMEKENPTQLDEKFHSAHELVFEEVDCLACGNCCKTTSPIFLMSDIKRLATVLNMSVKDFMVQYLTMDEDDDFVLTHAPCPFLNDNNKCNVYADRPKACREYPHTNRKNMHQILDLTYHNALMCPAVSMIIERLQSSAS